MRKQYQKPAVDSVEGLSFETVCAGSGMVACSFGKNAVEPGDSQCQSCFKSSNPNLVGMGQDNPADWASAIGDWVGNKGHSCREDYNLSGKIS